ncbi:type II toxin-antitoxin system RelE/ParE family toxin [Aliterella atlantica]|uniref:Plasmid stabilization protein n=1 Tax=Aliterella atlantica CENA595 TaxID=1618023 RepID=A0A0D8ZU70_9CYAN|nr:type II toxin-antitoxin system RelE/ParE family toxin [Aliterella atlantica]KJH70786.1 plasmid stabilization protein [Aliterella atlantica CENA595]
MKVVWTETAINQLQAIYGYIAQNSVVYAHQVVDRITRRSEQIAEFPNSGRIVPEFREENIREIIERPYRIIYRIEEGEVDILAIVHGSQVL